MDAPKAGWLFTIPPASCVGALCDELCIDSHLHESPHSGDVSRMVVISDPYWISTWNVTVAVAPTARLVIGTETSLPVTAPAAEPLSCSVFGT
jgi:hypothetical protein